MKEANKKITVDARMLHSSGIGTVIQNVLKRLICSCPEWKFYVIGNKNEVQEHGFLSAQNVTIVPTTVPIYSIQEQLTIPRLIPKDSDLLWVPHYNVPVLYNGPMVVTIHDVFHLAMPQFVGGIHKKIYAKLMFKAAVRKAKHIVCVSEFTKDELIKYTHADMHKISIVYNGVDDFWGKPLANTSPLYEKPYILYVGNVKPHKNLKRLVQAYEKIAEQIPQDLVIVGKKEGFITGDPLVAKMAEKMPERIHFTGFVSNEELKNYYHYADLFVFPSLYEGFGLPPLEAMKAGCNNVICSDIPVLHEIYGDNIRYFNPIDVNRIMESILLELNKKPIPFSMIRDSFNWNTCANEYFKIMNQSLSI